MQTKIIIILLFFFFSFLRQSVAASDPDNLRRFGVGWYGRGIHNEYENYNPVDLGVGWYATWNYDAADPKVAADLFRKGIQRLALVRLQDQEELYSQANCKTLQSYVSAHPDSFSPNMVYWSIGNELGYLHESLTAKKYADEFVNWYNCIKSIDNRYQVGSGATMSLWVSVPLVGTQCLQDKNDSKSSYTYLKTYVNRIKEKAPEKLPDFMVMHAYFGCTPPLPGDNSMFSKFKNTIISHRQALKELGLQNKELWIKEYNPSELSYFNGREEKFLKDSIDYLITAKDKNIGYSNDDWRLVQRFAWFAYTVTPNSPFTYYPLASLDNGRLLSLGEAYRLMSHKYADNPKPTKTPTATSAPKPGDANGDGKVDGVDYVIWLNHYNQNTSNGATDGDFDKSGLVDGVDYVIWWNNTE